MNSAMSWNSHSTTGRITERPNRKSYFLANLTLGPSGAASVQGSPTLSGGFGI